MELYWQEHKLGLQLILSDDERNEIMGRIRRTKDGGYNVNARAFGYNPERAAMGMASLDEAKAFVESFRTWEELVGPSDLAVEAAVRPLPDAATTTPPSPAAESPSTPVESPSAEATPEAKRPWWQFWRKA